MRTKIIQQLTTATLRSPTKMKHAAMLVRRGRTLCMRSNAQGMHAEAAVLRGQQCWHASVIVLRCEYGYLKNSKPCRNCITAMRRNHVYSVTYSTGLPDEPFRTELMCNISNTWVSRC